MLNIAEVTGAWTIPFGIDLGNTFWETINSTGLFLIPFSISIVNCWLKARSGGQDEGSSAIMFIKLLEKSWISMFFCMLVFVIPVNESTYVPDSYTSDGTTTSFSPINFKVYSCRGDHSTILPSSTTSGNVSPNLPFTQTLNTSLPLFMGLANQMFQGYAQSLNAMIPCDENMNAAYLMAESASFNANGDDDIQYSAKQFVNQCYLPAMKNISTSISNGLFNDGVPLNTKERWFNSTQLIAAYTGSISLSDTESYFPLYMPYDSEHWSGTGGGDAIVVTSDSGSDANEDKMITCTSAQTQIYSVIAGSGGEFDDHYSELITKAKTTEKAYPNKEGSYDSNSDILNKYAHQFLMDITGNVSGMFNVNHSANAKITQQRETDMFGDIVARGTTLFAELGNNISNFTLSLVGGVIVSTLIAVLFAASPLVLTLSGYSFKVASGLIYTLAFLIGTSYVLDLGWYIENVIIVLVSSSYSVYITDPVAVNGDVPIDMLSMMNFIQSSVVVTLLGVWSLMGGMLGVMVIPAFSQVLNTFSNSVGENGAKVASMAIKLALKLLPTKLPK